MEMIMEKVVSVVGDYWVYASLDPVSSPNGLHRLAFSTRLSSAKNPDDKQVKFEVYLDSGDLATLRDLLNS